MAFLFLLAILLLLCHGAKSNRESFSFDFGWYHRTGLTEWAQPDDEPPIDTDPGAFPSESLLNFSQSDWIAVTLPHDGLIANAPSTKACPGGCSGNSYIPRHVLWYRKKFTLPQNWKSSASAVWLDFQGAFRNTTVYINGIMVANHVCGYTPFRVRLDGVANFGSSSLNVIAVYCDPDNGDKGGRERGSGWWYEGGGLYRSVDLIKTNKLHIEPDGLFVYSSITTNGTEATVHARAAIEGHDSSPSAASVCLKFELHHPNGTLAASTKAKHTEVSAQDRITVTATMKIKNPILWSSSSPTLYSVTATVLDCSGDHEILDSVSVVHGFRSQRYDANHGFFLNHEHYKVRGFCDHNNFAVVGMAVPDRIKLFRAQALRTIGGNARRMSHNPPSPIMLDIYDRLGIVVMDENRLFDDNANYVENMGVLVKRDRNHPSVMIWSFCNEGDCEGDNQKGGPAFRDITYQNDGTRPTLANMFTYNDLLSNLIDVQGFSHRSREDLDECHAALPNKPIYMSECCSCNTMRSEDIGCETKTDNPHDTCTEPSFNARCLENTVNASDGVNYAVGTMVWTLFDYYGEPPVGGVEVSSTYGQFDLCGFPKSAAFWFRTQWLLSVPDARSDKTFPTHGKHEVHIVESWESPDTWDGTKGNTTRVIHAYSDAPFVELLVNGKSQGSKAVTPMTQGPGSYAEWTNVPWAAGRLTAIAHDTHGANLAQDERFSNAKVNKLEISIDAPSEDTGTGKALMLNGQDAALVRASVLDEHDRLMIMATNNVTFEVISGPGVIQGTGNGDPHCQEPNDAPWHSAYHGLVRAVVRVTSVAGRSAHETAALRLIDHDGPMSVHGHLNVPSYLDVSDIVVEARSPGFDPVRVSIPTSVDSSDSVLSIAATGGGKPVHFFGQHNDEEATAVE